MGFRDWLTRTLTSRPDGDLERGTTQDWVDMVIAAQEQGFLRTSMPTLDEEQVTGSFNSVIKSNSPVWSLTLARMQVFSQARFQWARFERGEVADLFGTEELGILERPWPGGTTADLLARMELDVTGAGNSYTRRLRRRRFGEDRLVRMRPDWVYLILGSQEDAEHPAEAADVELLGYVYAPRGDRGDRMVVLEPGEVGHYAPYPDPDGVFTGMSWITSAWRDILGDNLMTDHKRSFLRNAATPNLVIKFDPKVTIEQVREFKKIFEAEHKGVANAYKTLFLGGGADPVTVGKDFQQLEFSTTQGKAEARLASAAGVPPSWVGFSEGLQGSALNQGNQNASRRRFGDGTMQHLWQNAATSLEPIVDRPTLPRSGRQDTEARLWFASRGIPFLQDDATEKAQVQSQEASTIAALIREGFIPESIIDAVQNRDWSRLVHTGRVSVQLQEPGATQNGNGDPDRARAAITAGGN